MVLVIDDFLVVFFDDHGHILCAAVQAISIDARKGVWVSPIFSFKL